MSVFLTVDVYGPDYLQSFDRSESTTTTIAVAVVGKALQYLERWIFDEPFALLLICRS